MTIAISSSQLDELWPWIFGGLVGVVLVVFLWLWMRDVWNRPLTDRLDRLIEELRRSHPAQPPVTVPAGSVTCRFCGCVFEEAAGACPKCGRSR